MTSVAVIITSYNDREYIAEAIESVVSQTVVPETLYILDDDSSDGTQDIIREHVQRYPDTIEAHFHDKNLGVSKNRNYGLEVAEEEYITFLDSDNIFAPEKIEAETSLVADSPDVGLAFSDFYYTESDGTVIGRWCGETAPPTGDVHDEILTRDWPSGTLFSHPLIERELFEVVGGYDEQLKLFEDWDIFIRITAETNVAYTGRPLVEYRQVEGSLSDQAGATEVFEAFNHILNKHLPEYVGTELYDQMQAALHNREAEMHYESGDRFEAIRAFVRAVNTDPSVISKGSLRYFLPKRVFEYVRGMYGRG